MVSSRKLPCGESANSGKKYAPWDCSALVCKRFRKVTLQLLQTEVKILKNSVHINYKDQTQTSGKKISDSFSGTVFLGGYFATEVCDEDMPDAYRGPKPNKMPQ